MNKIVEIEIYNQTGDLILNAINNKEMNISSLATGVYWCKVFIEDGRFGVKKILKQ